jgi:peptide/nickel transport system permease protein
MKGALWERFWQKKAARRAWTGLKVFLFLALLAPLLANERPLVCHIEKQTYWPLFRGMLCDWKLSSWPNALLPPTDWAEKKYDWAIYTLIPYSPGTIDRMNLGAKSPFEPQKVKYLQFRHWLGTDLSGRDLTAGLLYGARTAMLVGLVSMLVAGFFGLLFGGLAGYYGDTGLRISRMQSVLWALFLPLAVFYGFLVPYEAGASAVVLRILVFLSLLLGSWLLARGLKKIGWAGPERTFPIDSLVLRAIEILDTIPDLILIMAIAAVLKEPSVYYIMAVVGLINWTRIARFVRAEFLRIKSLTYIDAAKVLGFSERRIIWRHAMPNALGPFLVSLALGIASAILLESTISILGLGVRADQVTWGSIMAQLLGKHDLDWWLALFPGLAIFLTVLLFNTLGKGVREALGE